MQENENYELDPNFAVVCSFLERFGKCFGEDYAYLTFKDLKDFLEASEVDVNDTFVRLHKKLARGIGEAIKNTEEWYKVIIKFCKDFPDGDNLLIKEKGYTNIPITAKLRILKNLCEDQFEYNDQFNRLVNEQLATGTNLRHEPVGKDRVGRSYWFMRDKRGGLRLYRRWWNGFAEDESWKMVSSDVSELEKLIGVLEGNEDMKPEDLPVTKTCDISLEKYISSTDLLSTAADDAANMVYFSGKKDKKDYSIINESPGKRSKSEIKQEEKKHHLPHCDVRLQTLEKDQLKKYLNQISHRHTSDDSDSSEIETERNEAESKPYKEDGKNDIEHINSTSDNSKESSLCNGISSDIKEELEGDKTNPRGSLKTCNDARKIVQTNSDKIKEENGLKIEQKNGDEIKDESNLKIVQTNGNEIKEENGSDLKTKIELKEDGDNKKENEASETESKQVPLINSKGDACSKEGNKADKIEQNETCIKSDTESKEDSLKEETDSDNEKSVFDHAIQDLLLLDGKSLKDEHLKSKKPLFNGTKNKPDLVTEAKVIEKLDKEGLCGPDNGHCNDKLVVDKPLKDLKQLESQKTSCSLSFFITDDNKTLQKSSEELKTASSSHINDITRLEKGKKSLDISSDETSTCKAHSEVKPDTNGKVKDLTIDMINKENIVIKNESKDNGRTADHAFVDTVNKGENLKKEGRKNDEKKTMSMLVGDEVIEIQEASSDSGDESESEELGKVLKKVSDKHIENNKLCNSEMISGRQIPVSVGKVRTENVQTSIIGTINTTGHPTAGINMPTTILVPLPVSMCPTKMSLAPNIKTVYVPLVTNNLVPAALPSGQPRPVRHSLLHVPNVSCASASLLPSRNPGGVRSMLQNKLTSGSLPTVSNTAPRIIFAPTFQAPPVVTLQKPLSSVSSQVVQKQSSNGTTKPMSNCDKTIIKTNANPSFQNKGNIPKVVKMFEEKPPSVSVQNVTIVIGKDGIHYDKSTGKPYKYPDNRKYVVAGPRGKFYDKETGYEVDVPSSQNLKHVPGTVYLASGVAFTKEVQEKFLKKKRKERSSRKCSKKSSKSSRSVDITSSDEEFAKMLESEMEKSSEEESDHADYDYEKISERVRMAKSRKLPVREQYEMTDPGDDVESDSEMIPLVLGRNAKRAAAKKLVNNSTYLIDEELEDGDHSKLCTVCSNQHKPSLVLICDECGSGYHMTCLFPPLLLVPLEDWFCPQCEHLLLIKNLKEKLKEVRKVERTIRNKGLEKISKKAFSIDADNIVELERRSCRQKREVSYSEAKYDNMFTNVFTEGNATKKKTRPVYSSDSDSEMDTRAKVNKQLKTKKRSSDRASKSQREKKSTSSGQSKAKKRKLTCLEDESDESGSEYKQSDGTDSSEPDLPAPKSELVPAEDELYFTSSGRKIKHISYKIT